VPEFIDPVFAKTSPKSSISISENERFGLVFALSGSINSGIGQEMINFEGTAPVLYVCGWFLNFVVEL
jgi:hypothetical protein